MSYNDIFEAIEKNGIGRPSTYATIIATLTKHKYIERKGKSLIPTQIAFDATDLLVKYFKDVMDVDMAEEMVTYTKNAILNESAMAMLSQANKQPEKILTLLQ